MQINTRVQLHPATDLWIRGDRYGTITKVTPKYCHVLLDRSGKTCKVKPDDLLPVG
jgi:hypothetical protein